MHTYIMNHLFSSSPLRVSLSNDSFWHVFNATLTPRMLTSFAMEDSSTKMQHLCDRAGPGPWARLGPT